MQAMISSLSASDKHLVVLSVFVSVFNLLRASASKFQVMKGECGMCVSFGIHDLIIQRDALLLFQLYFHMPRSLAMLSWCPISRAK